MDKTLVFIDAEGIVVRRGRTQRIKADDSFVCRQKGVDMLNRKIYKVGSYSYFTSFAGSIFPGDLRVAGRFYFLGGDVDGRHSDFC